MACLKVEDGLSLNQIGRVCKHASEVSETSESEASETFMFGRSDLKLWSNCLLASNTSSYEVKQRAT